MQRLTLGFLLILAVTAVTAAVDPVMYCDDTVAVGSVLQVTVSGNGLQNLTLSLVDSQDRAISRSEGFRWRGPGGHTVSAALLGIPSNADPGFYTLVLNANQGRAEWRQEKRIRLTGVDYPEMVIRMNGEMAGLYSDDSDRKKVESRILWTILTTTDTTALYHFDNFTSPLENGESTAAFGDRRRYRMPDGSESSSIHLGHDWWAEAGTPILAAGRGRVVLAAERLLTGNTVIIEHLPGVYTLYYHLDSIDVLEGEMINQGRRIGAVGKTGFATGEHLHWEMRVGATPVNALEFLERPLLDTNELISKM